MEQSRPDLSDNPFLALDDPRAEAGKHQAEAALRAAEFQRLCYSVFHEYADGKKLWEQLEEMYLKQTQVDPRQANSRDVSLWWDGFKACMLGMYQHGLAHIKRVNGV